MFSFEIERKVSGVGGTRTIPSSRLGSTYRPLLYALYPFRSLTLLTPVPTSLYERLLNSEELANSHHPCSFLPLSRSHDHASVYLAT